ncbi:hypothetical protein ONZ45_g13658 [Pleurotus djamor]|nr:hypothetical protein ONZ45_g13658 [Pleurotus djamor]
MSNFGRWLSPLNFSLRVDVNLEDFAQNVTQSSQAATHDEDVGSYPDIVQGPESALPSPLEVDQLLAKKMPPPANSETKPSKGDALCSSTSNSTKKQLSKAAQDRAKRSREYKHAQRRKKQAELQKEAGTSLKAVSLRRAMAAKCVAASTTSLSDQRHAPSGYAGYASRQRAPVGKELSGLLEDGFEYIDWDGVSGIYMLDRNDRIIVCGGSPKATSEWEQVSIDAVNAIKEARERCRFTAGDQSHRRGKFPAMARGILYGNGLFIPSNIGPNTLYRREAMDTLLENEALKRIAGFQSCLLDAYAPEQGKYYRVNLSALMERDPRLRKNFDNSSFAAITVNFGPRTVSVPHVDHANLATGMCALTALGDFDPDEGGQLVLWDLKIIIRFPPGSTLLFPSALIKHSNIPIQDQEQRYSVTQYSSGGLFRWVENGFCSDKDSVIPGGKERQAWEQGLRRLQVRIPQATSPDEQSSM